MLTPIGPSKVDAHAPVARWTRWHGLFYLAVVVPVNVFNYSQGSPWWAFAPSMTWSLVLTIHYFIYKSVTIDEAWVDERALQIREHSYDFDHKKDLEQRIIEDGFSVHAHTDARPRQHKRSYARPRPHAIGVPIR